MVIYVQNREMPKEKKRPGESAHFSWVFYLTVLCTTMTPEGDS